MPRFWDALGGAIAQAGRLIFPPYCIGCGRISEDLFCADCAAKLARVMPPICPRCGKPLHTSVPRVNCGHCSQHDWAVASARALFVYEGAGREALHRLKYGGRRGLARFFGNVLAEEAGNAHGLAGMFGWELGEEAQLVVPLPLHPRKRFQRGFNQNELVLRFYAPVLGLPVVPSALARVKLTRPQVRLTEAQRFDNVRGAFAVPQRMRSEVEGKRVLLLDDVITTGATINAAARALKKAGVEKIYALALFTSAQD